MWKPAGYTGRSSYDGGPFAKDAPVTRILLAALALAVLSLPAAAQGRLEKTLVPIVINTGKWAEGVGHDGRNLWVAESGERRMLRIDAKGVQTRFPAGRLPVDVVGLGGGFTYVIARTDKALWRFDSGARAGKVMKVLPEEPVGLAIESEPVWILTWPDGSSKDSRALRFNHATGEVKGTRPLGAWGQAIAATHDKVFVGHAAGERLSVIDSSTLVVTPRTLKDASIWALAGDPSFGLVAGGRVGQDNARGLLLSIDPQTGLEKKRIEVNQLVVAVAGDARSVVALGKEGAIWTIDPKSFELTGVARLDVPRFDPASILVQGERLVVTARKFDGENGAVFVVEKGWR